MDKKKLKSKEVVKKNWRYKNKLRKQKKSHKKSWREVNIK